MYLWLGDVLNPHAPSSGLNSASQGKIHMLQPRLGGGFHECGERHRRCAPPGGLASLGSFHAEVLLVGEEYRDGEGCAKVKGLRACCHGPVFGGDLFVYCRPTTKGSQLVGKRASSETTENEAPQMTNGYLGRRGPAIDRV